ncbi:hypothetical protein [Kingella potus]|uniref:hypothetical protein n=1 Tax=Kingella potus TaxID=265175 RepID=UPI001FD07BFC|nr:hypothetical protein [Kingella potus]UOP01541.1 hypothetical protein LVJ84_04940 [Kingella potus]
MERVGKGAKHNTAGLAPHSGRPSENVSDGLKATAGASSGKMRPVFASIANPSI